MNEEINVVELIYDEEKIDKTLRENPDMFEDYDNDGLGASKEELLTFIKKEVKNNE